MQKSGIIEGALVGEEFLESTDSWSDKNRAGGTKGAQQYYSPVELAQLAKHVIGTRLPVLDPTAGDGSLLREFDPGYRYGIEIDPDQINNATEQNQQYKSVKGDLQHVYPLLRQAAPEFDAIVANPPFDLKWSDPTIEDGRELSSTKLTFIYLNRLLSHNGQYIFICGRDRYEREIAELPEAKGVYAIIEINDLFEDVVLPCVIVFGLRPDFKKTETEPPRREFTRATLDLASAWVEEHRRVANFHSVASYTYYSEKYADAWTAIQKEYNVRLKERLDEKFQRKFDIELHGNVLNVVLSPYAQITLNRSGDLYTIRSLHRHNVNYFRMNEASWRHVVDAVEDGTVTCDPRVIDVVERLLEDNRRISAPLYPIKDVQRLGWLSEIDKIKCKRTDEARGFYAGEKYSIHTRPSEYHTWETRYEPNKTTGEYQEKKYEQMRKRLEIRIDAGRKSHRFYDDDEHVQDIAYLTEHFEIPAVPDIGERFPDDVHRMRLVLAQIENDTLIPNTGKTLEECLAEAAERESEDLGIPTEDLGIRLRKFQREDIARILVKGGGLLAWEQGLGKTLGALMYHEACVRLGSQDAALFIVPQDLVKQWQREARRFFNRELELIAPKDIKVDNPDYGKVKHARKLLKHTIPVHAVAKEVDRRVREGESGWFVTYYEALAILGTKREGFKNGVKLLPTQIVKEVEVPGEWVPGRYEHGPDGTYVYKEAYQKPSTTKQLDTTEICPSCHADTRSGWNGIVCSATNRETGKSCGYVHIAARIKPMGSILTTTFRKGTIIVDELTMIQGDFSKRSTVIRGLRARNKLGMTGTPIKNYIHQAFWLLWWTLGNASKRFPYDYHGGKLKFAKDFCVWEWNVTSGVKNNGRAKADVTNLSMLWKLLAASIIRRRKEETGEPIVDKRYHEHYVPLGVAQSKQMAKWLRDFYLFFEEKYPEAKVVKAGAHKMLAPMLGMQPKLEYAATLPLADPDYEWTGVPNVSNFTPANLRTLELAMALASEGRKVLVGSSTKETGRWLAEQLQEKGVNAAHILDASGQTAGAAIRGDIVHDFQANDTQVFCAGIQAIRLGHNLDAGSAIVINGLPWDWESFDQFVARVHRLTSKQDVDVHLVLPVTDSTKTITQKKWDLLQAKGQAADLALDGRLIEKDIEEIKVDDVLRELQEKGITPSDDEVPESEAEATWLKFPEFEAYTPPPGITKGYTVKVKSWTPWEAWCAVMGDHTSTQLALPLKACETISEDERAINRLLREKAANEEQTDTAIDTPAEVIEFLEEQSAEETTPDEEPVFETTFAGGLQEETDEEEVTEDTKSSDLPPEPVSANGNGHDQTKTRADIIQSIRDLKELLDLGALTDEEFTESKTALLSQLKEAA